MCFFTTIILHVLVLHNHTWPHTRPQVPLFSPVFIIPGEQCDLDSTIIWAESPFPMVHVHIHTVQTLSHLHIHSIQNLSEVQKQTTMNHQQNYGGKFKSSSPPKLLKHRHPPTLQYGTLPFNPQTFANPVFLSPEPYTYSVVHTSSTFQLIRVTVGVKWSHNSELRLLWPLPLPSLTVLFQACLLGRRQGKDENRIEWEESKRPCHY